MTWKTVQNIRVPKIISCNFHVPDYFFLMLIGTKLWDCNSWCIKHHIDITTEDEFFGRHFLNQSHDFWEKSRPIRFFFFVVKSYIMRQQSKLWFSSKVNFICLHDYFLVKYFWNLHTIFEGQEKANWHLKFLLLATQHSFVKDSHDHLCIPDRSLRTFTKKIDFFSKMKINHGKFSFCWVSFKVPRFC